jgi:hypothetical protein
VAKIQKNREKAGPRLPEIITIYVPINKAKILNPLKKKFLENRLPAKQKSETPMFPKVIVLIAMFPLSLSVIEEDKIPSIFLIEIKAVIIVA